MLFRVCKEMGWTYTQLMEQPAAWVEQVIEYLGLIGEVEQELARGT